MAQLKTLLTNFSSGELEPGLNSRTDVKAYFKGCKQLKNFSLLQHGGVMRRPGAKYIDSIGETGRLLPFRFSDTEEYLFVFMNTKLRIYDVNNSTISLTQEITSCPWTTATIFELNFAQYGDTMYVVHRLMQPQIILRTSATTFTRSNFSYATHSSGNPTYQPYYKFAPATMTLNPSGTSGTITLTTSADYWTDDHEAIRVRYKGKEILTTTKSSATVMNGTVLETLASSSADQDWDEQAFSAEQKYPSAICFHEDRLWFGGSPGLPNGIWASQTGDYDNFNVDDASASDSIQVLLGSDQISEIRHMVSSRHLQLFTDSGEFYETSSTTTSITPASITLKRQTPFGCDRVQPQLLDGGTLFSQKSGKAIREFLFTDLESAYSSNSVSTLSSHLIGTPTDSTVMYGNSTRPEAFAYFVMTDGTLAVFHSIRIEKLAGWSQWKTRFTSDTDSGYLSISSVGSKVFTLNQRRTNNITTSLDATAINVSNGLFTKTSHGLTTGNDVIITNNGGVYPSGTVNSVATTVDGETTYYVYRVDANTFYLHTTSDGAAANSATTRLVLTSQGSGSFVISDASSPGTTDLFTIEQLSEANSLTLDCSFTDTAYANGTPLVKGASNTGNTLVIDGLTDQPFVGEQFTIAGLSETHTINGVSTMSSGEVTLTLNDALASTPADNAAITFTVTRIHDGFTTLNGQSLNFVSPSSSPVYSSGTLTVANGKIVLPEAYATVKGGYNYTPTLESMPIDINLEQGSLTGEKRRINRVNLDLNEARNISVNNKNITFRAVKDDQQADPSAFTGRKEIVSIGYSDEPTVLITQQHPLEAKILGMSVEVRV